MINIKYYFQFWERLAKSVTSTPRIGSVSLVGSPQDVARQLSALKTTDYPALFVAIPEITAVGLSIDDTVDVNQCLLFLLDRYDPQRKDKNLAALMQQLQLPLEGLRNKLFNEASVPCSPMHTLDVSSISIMAVTDQYANTAGWSMAFNFEAGFDAVL